MTKRSPLVYFAGPISAAMQPSLNGGWHFDEQFLDKWGAISSALKEINVQFFSAHMEEEFGQKIDEKVLIERDFRTLHKAQLFLGYFPQCSAGEFYRSDGLLMELGAAIVLRIPILLIIDRTAYCDLPSSSLFFKDLTCQDFVKVLSLADLREGGSKVLRQVFEELGLSW